MCVCRRFGNACDSDGVVYSAAESDSEPLNKVQGAMRK